MTKVKTCICMTILIAALIFAGVYVYHANFQKTNITADATLI